MRGSGQPPVGMIEEFAVGFKNVLQPHCALLARHLLVVSRQGFGGGAKIGDDQMQLRVVSGESLQLVTIKPICVFVCFANRRY